LSDTCTNCITPPLTSTSTLERDRPDSDRRSRYGQTVAARTSADVAVDRSGGGSHGQFVVEMMALRDLQSPRQPASPLSGGPPHHFSPCGNRVGLDLADREACRLGSDRRGGSTLC